MLFHHVRPGRAGFGREHPHRGLQRLLGRGRAQELDELAGGIARGRVAAPHQRHTLDLAEHAALEEQVGSGRNAEFFFGVEHLGGRAAGIADDDGPRAAVACELGVVGLGPALDHFHAVGAHLRPPLERGLFAQAGDGGEDEGLTGAGRGRVLHHEQLGVGGFGQVFERGRQRQALAGEPGLVDVEVHEAVVHRDHARDHTGLVGALGHGHGRGALRGRAGVGVEHLRGRGARQQGVVDAVDHVGDGPGLGEDQLVDHLAGVTGLDDLQLHARVFFELRQQLLGQIERTVCQHAQRHRLRPDRGRCAQGREGNRNQCRRKKPPLHVKPPCR